MYSYALLFSLKVNFLQDLCCKKRNAWGFLCFLLFLLSLTVQTCMTQQLSGAGLVFEDVANLAGINTQEPSHKFGGPFVADLDNDGIYDLILTYHAKHRIQILFGNPNGTFTLSNFTHSVFDVHGVNVAQRTSQSREKIMAISVGGGRGDNNRAPLVYKVSSSRTFTEISNQDGLGQRKGRGRSALFIHISLRQNRGSRGGTSGPDVIFVGFLGKLTSGLRQYAYENVFGKFELRSVIGFGEEKRGRVEVTDIDNDGDMEIISIREMQIYKKIQPFEYQDVSSVVMPEMFRRPDSSLRNTAVAEIDFDNDGNFDLYIARANRTLITNRDPLSSGTKNDILLRNVDGVFVDVSEEAGIPKNTNSFGVTAGDFNNDGFVDLLVILYKEPDIILLNQGNGKFLRVNSLIPKDSSTVGNHAVAVDYNLDGRLDAIVGHGGVNEIDGPYRLMKSFLPLTEASNYLHVRVGNAPRRGATPLHATVTLTIGDKKMVRRVGSRGSQAGGGSYLDTVHFGLGFATIVDSVQVKWTNLAVRKKFGIGSNRLVRVGVF